MRVGCPIAFANLASRSCSVVISNFAMPSYVSCSQNYKQNSDRQNYKTGFVNGDKALIS